MDIDIVLSLLSSLDLSCGEGVDESCGWPVGGVERRRGVRSLMSITEKLHLAASDL